MSEQGTKLDMVFGPMNGYWLEYGLIPVLSLLSLSGLGMALWSGLTGRVPGFPIMFTIIYQGLSAFCGIYLTAIYKTERSYGPSRLFELLLLLLIALAWQWICAPVMGYHPAPLPVTGLGSGIHPSLLLFIVGLAIWSVGYALGMACSRSWPKYQPINRIDWLPGSEPGSSETAEECDLISLGQGKKEHALIVICCIFPIVLLTAIRPETKMQYRTSFLFWGIFQVIMGLLSISFYTFVSNRRAWRERRAKVDPQVSRTWNLAAAFVIVIALVIGTVLSSTVPERKFFELHKPAGERLVIPDKAYLTDSLDDTKIKAKELAKKAKAEAKASKGFTLPKGVRIVGSILMMVLFICFVTATILLALSFAVIILVCIIRLIPGLAEFAGRKKGTESMSDLTLLGKLLLPLSLVADLLSASGLEALNLLKRLAAKGYSKKRQIALSRDKHNDKNPKNSSISGSRRRLNKAHLILNTPAAIVRNIYARFIKRAGKLGYIHQSHETPREFAKRFPPDQDLEEYMEKVTDTYEHARYGRPIPLAAAAKLFEEYIRQITNRLKALTRK